MDKQWINDLTEFIFVQNEPAPADVIFLPGNGHAEPAEYAASLWLSGFAPQVLPSGRWSVTSGRFLGQISGKRQYLGTFQTEWAFMCAVLRENGVPEEAILREDQATFTWQNAILSRAVAESAGISVRRAILCCMPVHARRCLLYYSSVFPETEFYVCPAEGCAITRKTWLQNEAGIDAVLGEIERCGTQFHEILREKLLHPASFPSPLERAYVPNNSFLPQ